MQDTDALFQSVFHDLPADGWLTEPEARLLWRAARATTGPILEVGTYHGRSACLLAQLGRPLYCVDPFGGFNPDDPTGDVAHGRLLHNLAAWTGTTHTTGRCGRCGGRCCAARSPLPSTTWTTRATADL